MLWEIPHVQVSHCSLEQLSSSAAQYPWQAASFPLHHSKYSPERWLNLCSCSIPCPKAWHQHSTYLSFVLQSYNLFCYLSFERTTPRKKPFCLNPPTQRIAANHCTVFTSSCMVIKSQLGPPKILLCLVLKHNKILLYPDHQFINKRNLFKVCHVRGKRVRPTVCCSVQNQGWLTVGKVHIVTSIGLFHLFAAVSTGWTSKK